MKLILSRKGFDSASGGVANPILPDGRLCPLPIPDPRSQLCYRDMQLDNRALPACYNHLGALVADLSRGKLGAGDRGHLDPDLTADTIARADGWRPAFGQAGAAQGHLHNQAIGPGDLFLFYGWFRRVEFTGGRLQYVAAAPDLHVIYGWLQVDTVVYPQRSMAAAIPPWLRDHPHCAPDFARPNAIYVARERLAVPGVSTHRAGGGMFPAYDAARQLTAAGSQQRSVWRLPGWFYPPAPEQALSYHGRMARWQQRGEHVFLQTVGRGQEFVLDCAQYAQCRAWLAALLANDDRVTG
ncbi:MAG: hypothetical protein R3A44_26685 [Caldilineaceae bacterium]